MLQHFDQRFVYFKDIARGCPGTVTLHAVAEVGRRTLAGTMPNLRDLRPESIRAISRTWNLSSTDDWLMLLLLMRWAPNLPKFCCSIKLRWVIRTVSLTWLHAGCCARVCISDGIVTCDCSNSAKSFELFLVKRLCIHPNSSDSLFSNNCFTIFNIM